MRAGVVELLQASGLTRVASDEPLSRHTSWKVGGPADYFCVTETEQQLLAALRVARDFQMPWLVLGGGFNVLVADAGVQGLVILNRIRGIAIQQTHAGPQVQCGAGIFFAKAAQHTAKHGYTGMEWGISIPGTVGGGVVNNAGAHWSDVSKALVFATIIDGQGQTIRVSSDELDYGYRQSALKEPHASRSHVVVTGCRFRLQADSPQEALARIDDLRAHRIRTQPVKEASAGSTFKNPAGGHAGALVERVGLKGYQSGGAQFAPIHANFILNTGGATAGDIVTLIRLAQTRVREMCGVELEPEVQFVGRWSEDVLKSVLGRAA